MTKSIIKPCPFCGQEEAVYMQKESKSYAVVCDFNWGGCGACGGYRETPKEAAEAWNKRVSCNTCAMYYPNDGCMAGLADEEATE